LPADATQTWDDFIDFLVSQNPGLPPSLTEIPAPNSSQVGTALGFFDPGGGNFVPVAEGEITDVDSDKRVITNTVELGYKGTLADRYSVACDVYHTHVTDYFGELFAVTPSVFFDRADLQQYLEGVGLSSADAVALAEEMALIPVGTIAPDEFESADILLANRQGGSYSIWGFDLGLEVYIDRRLSLTGAYSWINDNVITGNPQVGDMFLSVPRNKGSLGLQFRDPNLGLDSALQFRAVESFPVVSVPFVGNVDSYTVVDVSVGYQVSWIPDLRISLNAYNVADNSHHEFVGGPAIGRLLISRVQVTF
jgi:outer membrane receptor protein involved in Fe transport